MKHSENYLGLDWGSVNIGVALAHAETGIAMAYTTYKNDASILVKLGKSIAVENIGTIIIGIPSYGSKDTTEYAGETMGAILEKKFSVHVEYYNEMFTTKMAQSNLIERGVQAVSKHDDAEAARIILQEWLDTKRHSTGF